MENLDPSNEVAAMAEMASYIHSIMIFGVIFGLVIAAVYFFVCHYIMSRKLDLE
jgi:heme/copper-type cytochrome/quinol oxidase subunit 2